MMVAHDPDVQRQARDVLFDASPTICAPPERHWFCPDETGFYCLACALPRANRRHVARAA